MGNNKMQDHEAGLFSCGEVNCCHYVYHDEEPAKMCPTLADPSPNLRSKNQPFALLHQNGKEAKGLGFLGEKVMESGRTILQRTHGASFYPTYIHDLQDRYEEVNSSLPTILLLRDPARTIISYWKLLNLEGSNKHLDEIPLSRFLSPDFHEFVGEATSLWEELAADRLLWCTGPLYVIHYEDLVHNPLYHLRRLLHFLRIPVDEGRLSCVSKHLTGPFKRKTNRYMDPFTEDEKIRFANAVKRINRLLLVLGYSQLPASDFIPHNLRSRES
nr:WSC domain-containing protein 1-like [Cherax quadricarinatus]